MLCSYDIVNSGSSFLILFIISFFPLPFFRLVGKGCKLVGCGSAVPTLEISNDDLSKIVETNDEWISVRTGIRNRRVLTGWFALKILFSTLGNLLSKLMSFFVHTCSKMLVICMCPCFSFFQ